MYEPVADHTITTIVEPTKYRNGGHFRRSTSFDEDFSGSFTCDRSVAPEKPPRKIGKVNRQQSRQDVYEVGHHNTMKSSAQGPETDIDIEHINLENGFNEQKMVEKSVQTNNLIPYRLRFWPRLQSDVKLSPSEKGCTKLRIFCVCRILSQWFLSQFGLTLILFIWALVGAYGFFITEGPREQEQSDEIAKIQRRISLQLTEDLQHSKQHDNWPSTIQEFLEMHKRLLLDAVSAGYGEGGEGSIWTYPGCILFSVSLLTTLGFGAPVPRTPQGRGAAILFAAVGIPLHFLLVLNMGNLMAIKLQQFAYKCPTSDIPPVKAPTWLKWFPLVAIAFYYLLGVILFGFVRQSDLINCFMFPLDFTAAGGVAGVKGHVRILYALYLEVAVTLAALIVSLIQASTSRGIVDICLRWGLLTNT